MGKRRKGITVLEALGTLVGIGLVLVPEPGTTVTGTVILSGIYLPKLKG